MEGFYVSGLLVMLVAVVGVNAGGMRVSPMLQWILFFFGFFFAMALGLPVMNWLANHIHEVTQQPPGKLGGGS